MIKIAITFSNVLVFTSSKKKKKNRIQRTSTKRESNQGNAIETMKAKPSGKERL